MMAARPSSATADVRYRTLPPVPSTLRRAQARNLLPASCMRYRRAYGTAAPFFYFQRHGNRSCGMLRAWSSLPFALSGTRHYSDLDRPHNYKWRTAKMEARLSRLPGGATFQGVVRNSSQFGRWQLRCCIPPAKRGSATDAWR